MMWMLMIGWVLRTTRTRLALALVLWWISSPSWAMENYSEVLRDQYGRAIGGAAVTVYLAGTQTTAVIYADNGVTPKENPLTTDVLTGQFNFYAANGVYDIVYFAPGVTFNPDWTRQIALFDINDFTVSGGSSNSPIPSGPTLPLSPAENYQFFLTTDDATGSCQNGGGSTTTLCRYNGVSWERVTGGGGGGTDLPATTISTSEAAKLKICGLGALSDDCWHIYVHSNGKLIIRGVKDGVEGDVDIDVPIDSGNQWCLRDASDFQVFCVNPSASFPINQYTFGSNYRPRKSIWFGADDLYGDGTNCPADPTAVTINSGPKIPTFICLDNDGSTLYGAIKMPDAWDAGTVTFQHVYLQTAANTGALNGDIACQVRGNGEAPSSTWGTEVPIDDAAVTGSNNNDLTTSGNVTCAGTSQAGDMLYFRYQLDATGTTTTIASLHHLGFLMEYSVTSWSD